MDRAIFMSSNEWKLPLNIAVGLHVLVILGSLYWPDLFRSKPKFAEIYSVSIINIAAPEQAPPAPQQPVQQQAEPAPIPAESVKIKKAVAIEEIARKPIITAPKAVSLKPLKKKKKKIVKKTKFNGQKKELDRLKKEKEEALRVEKLLEEKARLAKEALEAEKNLLTQKPVKPVAAVPQTRTGNQNASSNSSGNRNLIESQYFAAIVNRLHQFWALPENLQKNPDLTAVAVITIRKNGQIANLIFESKSGDRVFDQFVSKAIRSADPLPPIPPVLKRQRFEIGLRFKPGSIQ